MKNNRVFDNINANLIPRLTNLDTEYLSGIKDKIG